MLGMLGAMMAHMHINLLMASLSVEEQLSWWEDQLAKDEARLARCRWWHFIEKSVCRDAIELSQHEVNRRLPYVQRRRHLRIVK
jgi:hypothetical protein